ncbi:hypothetical protein GCM10027047_26080 [Rhodococcus aerolatus]
MTDTASSPAQQQSPTPEHDHWFGGASGGRVVMTGLVGTSSAVAWFASASVLVAVLAAALVLVAAVVVVLSL